MLGLQEGFCVRTVKLRPGPLSARVRPWLVHIYLSLT